MFTDKYNQDCNRHYFTLAAKDNRLTRGPIYTACKAYIQDDLVRHKQGKTVDNDTAIKYEFNKAHHFVCGIKEFNARRIKTFWRLPGHRLDIKCFIEGGRIILNCKPFLKCKMYEVSFYTSLMRVQYAYTHGSLSKFLMNIRENCEACFQAEFEDARRFHEAQSQVQAYLKGYNFEDPWDRYITKLEGSHAAGFVKTFARNQHLI